MKTAWKVGDQVAVKWGSSWSLGTIKETPDGESIFYLVRVEDDKWTYATPSMITTIALGALLNVQLSYLT